MDIFRIKASLGNISIHSASALIAVQYGVSSKAIRDIWTGRSWLNVTYDLWTGDDRPERKTLGRPKGRKDSRPRLLKPKTNELEDEREAISDESSSGAEQASNNSPLDSLEITPVLPSFNRFKAATLINQPLSTCLATQEPDRSPAPSRPSSSVLNLALDDFFAKYSSPKNLLTRPPPPGLICLVPPYPLAALRHTDSRTASSAEDGFLRDLPSHQLSTSSSSSAAAGPAFSCRPGPRLPPIVV